MIQELKIKNFLSFKEEVVFSFEATADKTLEDYYIHGPVPGVRLLKLALVYGANASGKSNLINAFGFLKSFIFEIPENKEESIDFNAFAFDDSMDEKGGFELVFYTGSVKYNYNVELDQHQIYKESLSFYPGTQPAIIFERHLDKKRGISIIKFGPKIKTSKVVQEGISLKTLRNSSVFAAYSQVNASIPEIEAIYNWFKDKFLSPINPYTSLTEFSDAHIKSNPDIKKQALKFIRKADFNISDISFKERIEPVPEHILKLIDTAPIPNSEIELIKKEKVFHIETTVFEHHIKKNGKDLYYQLPMERQSRGTQRFYGMSAPFFIALEQNAFLPIDEIGSSLHPLLVKYFIKEFLLKSDSAQTIITTHNMSILNEKDILRKDAIWFTEKEEDGSTELYSASDFNDFRKELSYFNYYKLGKFGAVPNVE